MKIFYAGGGSRSKKVIVEQDLQKMYELMGNHLIAWIDESELEIRIKHFTKDCFVLIDSGAFSAYTKGKEINITQYKEFIEKFNLKWKTTVQELNFINLDVIGNAEDSWNNQTKLESMGVNPIPVVHQWGFKQKYLERAFKEYKYFCFGGMWGRSRKYDTRPWLAFCFKQIMSWVSKGNKLPKIHLLGIGSDDLLFRFPCYSCDNTKWMKARVFGNSNFINFKGVPRGGEKLITPYKNTNKYSYNKAEDITLLIKIVKYDIKQIVKKELEITNFWKKRGVDFEI
jgi:hypothetical protein